MYIDIVIYINLDKDTRLNRVKQRSINQFGDRARAGGDLYEKKMAFFDKVYNRDERDFKAWFEALNCKSKIELDGSKSVESNVGQVMNLMCG